jgi:predicted DNA-binding ribbon-helix-helix protein
MIKSGIRYSTPPSPDQVPAEAFEALLAQGAPRKRSVTIAGHRTSVSLEHPFWEQLGAAAAERGRSLNALIAEIDARRARAHAGLGLSGALRLYVLARLLRRSDLSSSS